MTTHHENIIKRYTSTENRPPDREYAESKAFLETHFDKKTKGAILRSKSQYYEQNEKSSKYFLNLERRRGKTTLLKCSLRITSTSLTIMTF